MAGTFTIRKMAKRWQDANRVVDVELANLALHAGEVKALVGPSGCGKSTVLDMVALALRPDSLEYYGIDDGTGCKDVTGDLLSGAQERLAQLRARRFGYVVQTGALLPFLTAGENIALPQRLSGRGTNRDVGRMLEKLGISDVLAAYPSQLSVGQRQRVAVARGLAHNPDIVLLDEPTAALDPATAKEVLATCLDFARDIGAAMLIVTHDHELVAGFAIPCLPIETTSEGRHWRTRFADTAGLR